MDDLLRINQYGGRGHQSSRQKWEQHALTVKDNQARSGPGVILVKDGKALGPKGAWLLQNKVWAQTR